ncbi:MAG: exosortase/archaeosortase family protein [Candidatus Acidiferrales bacterium]
MSVAATTGLDPKAKRHFGFVAFIFASSLLSYKTLSALVAYSFHNASSSHIVLIPLVSFSLLYAERQKIFVNTETGVISGIGLALGGAVLYWLVDRNFFPQGGNWPLSLGTLSVVLVWTGGFLFCYGFTALRAAAFPLLFLLLMVPLPDVVLDTIVHALQVGSTEVAYLVFQAVGTPVIRQGFVLSVPGVTIEVAQECSSIRSSMALFITCLLAVHLYLRTRWKMVLFVLLSLPVSLIKNGIRIATLTLLSIHVNPGFLTGRLHREGGFAFFAVALLILCPVFLWLEESEQPRKTLHSAVLEKPGAETITSINTADSSGGV